MNTFASKFTIGQAIGYWSSGEEKIAIIIGVLFTKDKTMYELDSGDFLEEKRISVVFTRTSLDIPEFVEESSGVELEGVAHV